MSYTLNRKALERLKAAIKGDKYVDKPWSFTAEDSNAILGENNWTEYGMWNLGFDATEDKETKAAYAYPYGKNGLVYLSALRAIASRAAAQGDSAIADAASQCLAQAKQQDDDKKSAQGSWSDCSESLALVGSVEIKAAMGDGPEAKGPPTFRMVGYTGAPMQLRGWQYPVIVDMQGIQGMASSKPALREHDPLKIVGHTTSVGIKDGELVAEGVVSGHGPDAMEVAGSSGKNFPWQASIGAKVQKNQFVPEGESITVNGRSFDGPVNIARQTRLGEISFVALGADSNTSASIAACAAEGVAMKFSAWCAAKGFNAAEMTEDQRTFLMAAYKDSSDYEEGGETEDGKDGKKKPVKATAKKPAITATQVIEDEPEDPAIAIRAAHVAELKHTAMVHKVLAKFPDLEIKATEENWDETRCELESIKASRTSDNGNATGPMINANRGVSTQIQCAAITASMAISAGIREQNVVAKLPSTVKEQVMNIASAREIRGMGLHQLMRAIAAQRGISCAGGTITDSVIRDIMASERDMKIQADFDGGFSTMSLSGITENILNKAMLQAYGDVNGIASQVCYETDTNDFKQFKRYRLTASGYMQAVGPSGELKSMTLQDESYPNQVTTQGMIVTITRTILINDDMGALTQVPTVIGREAALYKERQVASMFLNTPSGFFSATANNYLSGATSALSIGSMAIAEQLFTEQVDANQQPIMVQPDRIMVTPANKTTAFNLFNGANLVVSGLASTSARTVEPDMNRFKGMYTPIVNPFLSARVGLTNSSNTAWFLLPNPSTGFAAVQIGYLRGQRVPIIERGEMNFNTLGIGMRCYYDFGVAAHDPRCGVKVAGA